MIERIRRDDYLYGFWLTKGGNVFWLIRRDKQLILQAIIGMTRHIHIVVPYESEEQVPMVTEIMKQFFCVSGNGEEFICLDEWHRIVNNGMGKILSEQFNIFDETKKQIRKEMNKAGLETKAPESATDDVENPESEVAAEKIRLIAGRLKRFKRK